MKLEPMPIDRESLPAKVVHSRSTPTARYLLQIFSKAGWKAVAYLNDLEEVSLTMENVPGLRVFDAWQNAELRLHGLAQVHHKQDRQVGQISGNVFTMKRRQRV